MQFDYQERIGKDFCLVTFTGFNISKIAAKEKLFENLRIIGGEQTYFELEWVFPNFITSKVIEKVISNTCFVCGGLMQNHTDYKYGSNRPIRMRKCTKCGHSHT